MACKCNAQARALIRDKGRCELSPADFYLFALGDIEIDGLEKIRAGLCKTCKATLEDFLSENETQESLAVN